MTSNLKFAFSVTTVIGVATIILLALVIQTNYNIGSTKIDVMHTTVPSNVSTTEREENNKSRTLLATVDRGLNVNISKLKMPHTDRNTWTVNRTHQIPSTQQKNDSAPFSFVPMLKRNDIIALGERKYKIAMYGIRHGMLRQQYRGVNMQKCYYYKNCEIVEQNPIKGGFIEADAVIFQGGRIPNIIPKHRDENQVFVFISIESPVYLAFTNLKNERYHNYFNWTMTYRVDSSIPYLYGSIVPKFFRIQDMEPKPTNSFLDIPIDSTYINDVYDRPVGIPGKNYSRIFRKKKKEALWFVSHCFTSSKREKYIEEFQKYGDIDIIGPCYENLTVQCKKGGGGCETILAKNYKFFMAFENSLCSDYITEKAFKWFKKDIVIVVRGARRYSTYLPKGTYIDTNDFATPRDLASHLKKLGSNETEYTNILKRKDSYEVIDPVKQVELSYCHLCYNLNNLNDQRDVVQDIYAWWTNGMCIQTNKIKDLK